jgi:2-oxoglutarate ferredoxin oxidoreductase subunit delta
MAMIKVDKNMCKGCKLCVVTCPKHILELSRDFNDNGDNYCVQTDAGKCIGCAFCAMICPDAAIEVYK